MDVETAPALYFHMGFSYKEIICALAVNHRIVISLRSLKRLLSRQNLFWRKNYTDVLEVIYLLATPWFWVHAWLPMDAS